MAYLLFATLSYAKSLRNLTAAARNRISREELHFVEKLINWLCES
jgi:hypothetical protein